MFPNLFFFFPFWGWLDHEFLRPEKKKNYPWDDNKSSPTQVTVTNPLEIPEINTWSFEHLWLGNFGLLGCPCYEMVRTDQWQLFRLLISKWDIFGVKNIYMGYIGGEITY